MDVLKIKKNNGTIVIPPAPAELKWNISDLDEKNSGRNQNGDLFRDRVEAQARVLMVADE